MSAELFQTGDNKPSWFEKNAVGVAYWVANTLIVVGEFRVYDFVYRSTGSVGLSVLAVLTVGIPFLLWEVLWKQRLANKTQTNLSFFMGLFTLLIAVTVGVADYVVAGVGGQTLAEKAQPLLLGVVAVMLSLHAVALLAYFLVDDNIKATRFQAREEARTRMLANDLERANALLAKKQEYLKRKTALQDLYGADVDKQLKVLAGDSLEPVENPTAPSTLR